MIKKEIKNNKKHFTALMIIKIINVVLDIYTAFILQNLTRAAINLDIHDLMQNTVKCIVYLLLLILNNYLSVVVSSKLLVNYRFDLRKEVFGKVMELNPNKYTENSTSHYLSILTSDIEDTVCDYLYNIPVIVTKVILFVSAIIVLLFYSPFLAILDIILGVIGLLAPNIMGHKIEDANGKYLKSRESVMRFTKDILGGLFVIKNFNAEKQVNKIYENEVQESCDKYYGLSKYRAVTYTGTEAITWMAYLLHVILCVVLILNGKIELPMMMGAIQMMNYVINPMNQINSILIEMKSAKAANKRIQDILNLEENDEQYVEVENVFPIEIKNFSFGYNENEYILENINYVFEKGKKYLLIGKSGVGKSTLLKCILKYYDSFTGNITYGGIEGNIVDKKSLYSQIVYLQQDVVMFNGTVRDNITVFQDIPEKDIYKAINKSGMQYVIDNIGNGLDGIINENGNNLSGGEKQRFALARAFAKNVKIIILDEADTNLDVDSAVEIEKVLLQQEGLTVIVISHRRDMETYSLFDEIIEIKDKKINSR